MHGVQPLMLDAVRKTLENYARRGVFRSLSETGNVFRFHWLWNAAFTLAVEEKTATLVFRGLLPGASAIEADVKAWLAEAASEGTVAHRRLDSRELTATCSRGSIRFRVRNGDFSAGVKRAIQAVNELFVTHLSARHPSYLVEHFHVSED